MAQQVLPFHCDKSLALLVGLMFGGFCSIQ
jgi:hypothetical protein